MGDAPSPGFSSRVSKTRGRRELKSKFSQRESLEIAGPDWPDPGVGRNEAVRARGVAAMDSLAAPQDRLVEQLLSPRTQAQRRLKVCVCVCVCVSVRVCRERERVESGSCVQSCLAWPLQLPQKVAEAPRADVHYG